MHDRIVIEQMKLSEKDNVLAFLKTAYADNPRHADPEFWDWHFPASPFCDPDNLPIWLAKSGGRIAGQLAATPVEFNVGGEIVSAIWILDLIVDPAFRRKGIAKNLALASKDFCPFVLGVNTTAQHSTELLEGLGWVIFTKIPRFQKILFPGNAMRETAGVGPLRSAANLAFAPLRPSLKELVRGQQKVKILDSFDSSFDDLWSDAKDQWNCSVSRTSAMLNWQFREQPGKRFEILGYFDGNKLRGYAVLFFRKPDSHGLISKSAVSDICYHPERPQEIVDALLQGALKLSLERRVGSLVTDALDPLVEERLGRLGFWRVKSDLQLLANVPEERQWLYDPAKWFLTRGDSDISIFEAPNL